MDSITKVCALPVRRSGTGWQVLGFEHPLAGRQLVKGTLEAVETPSDGAARELQEESGVALAPGPGIGSLRLRGRMETWHLVLFDGSALPDAWAHVTRDGGGLRFSFAWYGVDRAARADWPLPYRCVLAALARRFPSGQWDRSRS